MSDEKVERYRRRGARFIVPAGSLLPARCVKTGVAAAKAGRQYAEQAAEKVLFAPKTYSQAVDSVCAKFEKSTFSAASEARATVSCALTFLSGGAAGEESAIPEWRPGATRMSMFCTGFSKTANRGRG